jgi:hypothetical protein
MACGRADEATAPTISTDRFISVIVALREAAAQTEDAAAFATERDRILRDAGVTDSALVEFARVHSRDVHRMRAIWDTIAVRLTPAEADRAPPDETPEPQFIEPR